MKVLVSVMKEVECEIDDKFRALAVPVEETINIPSSLYEECVKAVEEATGIPFPLAELSKEAMSTTSMIFSVSSLENEEVMLEA